MKPIITFILCSYCTFGFAQIVDKSLIEGQFVLEKIEISQQFDSNAVWISTPIWSVVTNNTFSDTLTTVAKNDSLHISRSLDWGIGVHQKFALFGVLSGNQVIVARGFIFSPSTLLFIENVSDSQFVLIERYKMRQVRRTFRRLKPSILRG
ncbi:MAG: hypothetical protein HC817_08830 [Saprospiraceae bacterium]|nr:hypothetical protein [Saprospiraceae bacterium]